MQKNVILYVCVKINGIKNPINTNKRYNLSMDYLIKTFNEHLDKNPRNSIFIGLGLLIGWWIYVPFHELFHAWGCLISGGTVSRLEISALYGGNILSHFFSYVVSGSNYAGQLTGFDTIDSDFVYLVTVLTPYLLTLFPGWYVLGLQISRKSALIFGALLPWALAPLMAITGDMYEAGSIIATNLLQHIDVIAQPVRWRSDDLFLLWSELRVIGVDMLDIKVVGLSLLFDFIITMLLLLGGIYFAHLGMTTNRR